MDYKGRQQRLQSALASHRLDALLITHLPNVLYLCGFSGSAGAMVLTEDHERAFTDGRYTTQARSEVQGAKTVIGKKASAGGCRRMAIQAHRQGRRSYESVLRAEHLSGGRARARLAGCPAIKYPSCAKRRS